MRATFITTTLENGVSLEEVQKAAAIATPAPQSSTTGAAITRRSRHLSARIIDVAFDAPPNENISAPCLRL
jgi:hypothetical protein